MSISPSYPDILQNGNPADATQVMANFYQIQNDVNANAAENGANSSITSLSGLTTPLSIAQGGTGAASASAALTALGAAPLNSPGFTGTPTAPTPSPGDNSTKIATTAFITGTFAPAANPTFTGTITAVNLSLSGTLTVTSTVTLNGATTIANLTVSTSAALPAGATGVTPTGSDSSTKLATTAFVKNNAASARVAFDGTTGAILGTSINVSSVTRSSTGRWIVNFTSALSTSDYSAVYSNNFGGFQTVGGTARTTTTLSILLNDAGGSPADCTYNSVLVFGG